MKLIKFLTCQIFFIRLGFNTSKFHKICPTEMEKYMKTVKEKFSYRHTHPQNVFVLFPFSEHLPISFFTFQNECNGAKCSRGRMTFGYNFTFSPPFWVSFNHQIINRGLKMRRKLRQTDRWIFYLSSKGKKDHFSYSTSYFIFIYRILNFVQPWRAIRKEKQTAACIYIKRCICW